MAAKKLKKAPGMDLPGITFIKTNARRFVQIDLDYTDTSLFDQDLSELIPDLTGAIAYVSIRVKRDDLARVDINKIRDLTNGAYYCRDIVPVIVKERTLRIKALRKSIGALDAVDEFIRRYKPKHSKKIMQIAEKMIRDLGIDEKEIGGEDSET